MTQLSLFDEIDSLDSVRPVRTSVETSSLMALAESIRQGREELAKQRKATESIQQIGDLAQAVLRRHDLVARRRMKSLPVIVTSEFVPGTGMGVAGVGVAS